MFCWGERSGREGRSKHLEMDHKESLRISMIESMHMTSVSVRSSAELLEGAFKHGALWSPGCVAPRSR